MKKNFALSVAPCAMALVIMVAALVFSWCSFNDPPDYTIEELVTLLGGPAYAYTTVDSFTVTLIKDVVNPSLNLSYPLPHGVRLVIPAGTELTVNKVWLGNASIFVAGRMNCIDLVLHDYGSSLYDASTLKKYGLAGVGGVSGEPPLSWTLTNAALVIETNGLGRVGGGDSLEVGGGVSDPGPPPPPPPPPNPLWESIGSLLIETGGIVEVGGASGGSIEVSSESGIFGKPADVYTINNGTKLYAYNASTSTANFIDSNALGGGSYTLQAGTPPSPPPDNIYLGRTKYTIGPSPYNSADSAATNGAINYLTITPGTIAHFEGL
jgi:hypothetical protein